MNQLLSAGKAAHDSGHLTAAQHEQVRLVSEIVGDLPAFYALPEGERVAKLNAIDWQSFIAKILPIVMAFLPGIGQFAQIIPLIMQIISLFNGGGILPKPNGNGGGTFPVG